MTATFDHPDTRHFSYKTAANEFEIPERWLRTHIKTLPHRRFGRYVRFSTADMIAISEKHAAELANDTTAAPALLPASAVPDIRPSSQRRSRKQTSPNLREQAGLETNAPSRG